LKLPDKVLFWSFFVIFCTFCASLWPIKHLFSQLQIKVCPKGLRSFAFYILIFTFSLTSDAIRSTKDYVRKNKLFMQNKANFRKVKFDVNRVLTMDYDQLDTWSIRITKPIKANKSQLKPIKPNLSCRSLWRSRNKANLMLLKIALSLSRSLRYNECVMKNLLLRYKKHGNTE
jgi:hypothetical protein